MERALLILLLFRIFYQSCLAQETSKTVRQTSETDVSFYTAIIEHLENQADPIALNSIIEVNGIVHPRDTYGYFCYSNPRGINKKCLFQHLGGSIIVSKKDYDEILLLPDSSKVEVAICLQSPIYGDWGCYWDKVIVKGSFDVGQLSTTRNKFSPCFHFIITSLGKDFFKIQFNSWKVQTCYYSVDSCQMTAKQRRRLDRKEQNIYKRANLLDFDRKLW